MVLSLSHILLVAAASAADEWVYPQGLPAGHNGGVKELLVPPASEDGRKPHIMMLLMDDYGWANAGWHRNTTGPGGGFIPYTDEVQTPVMNQLVRDGIELDRQYVYKFCSPTRSALQSGRNPYHVNNINPDPTLHNPADPVSGFSAIPRNMTGIATKMAAAGYKTHAFGKWDAGMATMDHTPHGRGYMTSMIYFHHANDYWDSECGHCPSPPPPPGKRETCAGAGKNFQTKTCLHNMENAPGPHRPTASPADCCDQCAASDTCLAWAWGVGPTAGGNRTCFLKDNISGGSSKGNCTAGCKFHGCMTNNGHSPVDLWMKLGGGHGGGHGGEEGPARGYNNTCAGGKEDSLLGSGPGFPTNCKTGTVGEHDWYDGYEDEIFEHQVLNAVEKHDAEQPLFLFWAPHIVHAPLEVPDVFNDKFDMIAPTDNGASSRQRYHAMVNFADTAFGNVTNKLKAKGMWDNTIVVFTADNGGPIYNNGSSGANNFPLKGGKMNNWEGGIRVNAWISGGFLPQSVRGTKYEGLITGWDWYATFCSFAGVDPTDHRAALAELPAIDSFSHSAMILGKNATSPRSEIPIGTDPVASNVSTAPSCASLLAKGYGEQYHTIDGFGGDQAAPLPTAGLCTSVNGVIVDEGANGLWKLLTGSVAQDMFTGPHYPNASTNEISGSFVGHCANGCLYNIKDDPLEMNDLAAVMPGRVAALYKKILAYEVTAFNPNRGPTDPAACTASTEKYGGFWGPFVFP